MKILSLWSGPRSVSTALMYSFAQRPDTEVIDEPLYAHYLSKTEADHPGKQEVLDSMEKNGQVVIESLVTYKSSGDVLFLKNMVHHWIDLEMRWLSEMDHLFLIRNPEEMLPSLIHQIPNPVMRDTGLETQVRLFKFLEKNGSPPVVIDSKDLLVNPEQTLKNVCSRLGIKFYPEMLTWESGPRKEDGVWAKYWYHNVHKSTGFSTYQPKKAPFPERLKPLLKACHSYYQFLNEHALKN